MDSIHVIALCFRNEEGIERERERREKKIANNNSGFVSHTRERRAFRWIVFKSLGFLYWKRKKKLTTITLTTTMSVSRISLLISIFNFLYWMYAAFLLNSIRLNQVTSARTHSLLSFIQNLLYCFDCFSLRFLRFFLLVVFERFFSANARGRENII